MTTVKLVVTERFKHHEFNEEQNESSEALRDLAEDLETSIVLDCAPSREKALALTKLEECIMWANKCLALYGVWNQVDEQC